MFWCGADQIPAIPVLVRVSSVGDLCILTESATAIGENRLANGDRGQHEEVMCKQNFHQRNAALRKAKAAIAEQLDAIESERLVALIADREPPALSSEKQEQLDRLDAEDGRLHDAIFDLQEVQLATPVRSRHAITTRLGIVADRLGLPFDTGSMIEELINQIEGWRRAEPVILACAGKVNA